MKHVVVVGGGIAGLSAAHYLARSDDVDVTLVEAASRLGGKIATRRIADLDLLVELGPDSIFTAKPAALQLIAELGLESEIIEPLQNNFALLIDGHLARVPRSLASLLPATPDALLEATFFSDDDRARIRQEADVPKGDGRDESIRSFFRRRFGERFSQLLAEPLLAGIHSGDPEKLSMKALFPRYMDLENEYGSLTRAGKATAQGHMAKTPGFVALRAGIQSLVDALEQSLDSIRILKGFAVSQIARQGRRLAVSVKGSPSLIADHLILAVPSAVASWLLRDVEPAVSAQLLKIRHVSTAVVSLAYPAETFRDRLHGSGFLVPYAEPSDLAGCTWTSSKWEGRAPAGTTLMRCFVGRDGGLEIDGLNDSDLAARAQTEITRILHPRQSPTYVEVTRWTHAMPQRAVGHIELLESLAAALGNLPIHLIGGSYRASGIPDCIREGRELAERIALA